MATGRFFVINTEVRSMQVQLEPRQYDQTSSPEEVEAIRNSVFAFEGDERVIMYREVPYPSLFQIGIFEQRLTELTKSVPSYKLLIDLTRVKYPPDAEIRSRLKKMFQAQKVSDIAVYTGDNFMLSVAARFVLGVLGVKFSVHKTLEQASEALKLE
jgi:hypothetical protein